MLAVDTNVLVRLLVGDDPKQSAAAERLFEQERIWVAKTVLLESFWVLRSVYHLEEREIHDAFAKVLGLENVQAEDESVVSLALRLTAHGIEFADAIHVASKPSEAEFVSFDKIFVRRAQRAGVPDILQA